MSETRPLISIALCTYNGARYLPWLLDSVLAQTYPRIEVVACDDGSTDETVAILRQYAGRDERISVHVNTTNLGLTQNFEWATSLCRGELIAPCDQDDIWIPQKLDLLEPLMGDHDVVYGDSELMNEAGKSLQLRMSEKMHMLSTTDPAAFAYANCVSGHSMLFRRTLLPKALPIPSGFLYDWWIAAVAASQAGVHYVPEAVVYYRQHENNVTDILRSRSRERHIRGYRSRRVRDIGIRLSALAHLPGKNQTFTAELLRLWNTHQTQWFSWPLARFLLQHQARVFAIPRWSLVRRLRKSVSYALGLRTKQLTNRHAYCD